MSPEYQEAATGVAQSSSSPLPYSFYDDLRLSKTAVFVPLVGLLVEADEDGGSSISNHVGRNLHSVRDNSATAVDAKDPTSSILCHVPTFFRWTSGSSDAGWSDVSSEAYGGTAAALLAVHHFNNGIGSVSDQLDGINARCPIRFTLEAIDSASSGRAAVRELTRLVTRPPTDVVTPQPCAVIGSSWSGTTKKMATVTGVYDLLQVTPSASSVALDNAGEYPLFARTHPSDASMAELSVDYLHQVLGIKFIGQLYVDNDFGSSYHTAVLKRAARYNMTVESASFRPGAGMDEIEAALRQLEGTGFNYFLGIFFGGDYERVMDLAGEIGIAGPGRFWMFNGALASAFVNGATSFESDSNAAAATYGSAIIHDEGGLPGLPQFDRFLEEWVKVGDDADLLQYINSKQPSPPEGSDISFNRSKEFFLQPPSHIAAFNYDSIVGLGLSACEAYAASGSSGIDGGPMFSGADHHATFIKNNFSGASGDVIIGPNSFSRNAR